MAKSKTKDGGGLREKELGYDKLVKTDTTKMSNEDKQAHAKACQEALKEKREAQKSH